MIAMGNQRSKVSSRWPPLFMPRLEKRADGCAEEEEGGLNIVELGRVRDEPNCLIRWT